MKRRDLLKGILAGLFLAIPQQSKAIQRLEDIDMSTSSIELHLHKAAKFVVIYEDQRIEFTGKEIWEIFKEGK